ncbi:alpha/beta hydrolase family protein [Nocardioides albertanoniae]|uniref:Alpha/beta hydrolase family protein n=1 Tax=Nocardioides albertanoniae TaxID=1175486 RepID=A0A543A1S0_9ACTN|nr:alpha/beta hydrolase [Nocardioides albertanoniae]TQL66532.1 alpha/beta hydrolase family protein [Nocardioides albertanoniae]
MKLKAATGAVALTVLALSGCGAGDGGTPEADQVSPSAAATAAPEKALQSFYSQKLDWKSCNGAFECATLEVPLDYTDPAAGSIDVAVIKDPANKEKIGSLAINPGGPGGSGIDYALYNNQSFSSEVRDAYDIVGFDPRGVGQSTPVDCLDDAALDDYVAVDPAPDDAAEEKAYTKTGTDMAKGCAAQKGGISAHVSTVEAARDMDVLRAALGEDQLDYFGASYGTQLGSTYAELYPDRVGRFVLDGAIAPGLSVLESNLAQAKGFEVALRSYVESCVDKGDCFLGDTVDEGVERVQKLMADIDDKPLPAGDRELTSGNALYGLITPLYVEAYWPELTKALEGAIKGDGTTLMSLSDSYAGRDPEGGYANNTMEANWAINCLDDSSGLSPEEVRKELPAFEKAAPTFGAALAWMLNGCAGEKFKASEPEPKIDAEGSNPIVVVGTTRDPATPYEWAKELAKALDAGVLVSRDGDGHTGYMQGNRCVDGAINDYLVDGKVPDDGLEC